MKVRFWGVRGSIPTPGEHTRRWGGNTSCLEVRHGDLPPLVLDCGTGARALGEALAREPGRQLELLFTHLHMDHLFGLPFFAPLYTPSYAVRVTVPAYSAEDARDKVGQYLNGTYHPLRLADMPCALSFAAIRPGSTFDRSGWTLRGAALNHPGGAVGYRIEADGQVFVFVTDTAPFARPGEGLAAGEAATNGEQRMMRLLAGADVVVYDTMFTLDEYLEKMTWGHSYPEYALALCEAADVGELVLFHHRPDATDDELDAAEVRWAARAGRTRVSLAREGATLDLPTCRARARGEGS